MRLFYLLSLASIWINYAYGQELIPKTIDINPLYWPTDSTQVIKLKFKIKLVPANPAVTEVEFVLDPLTLSNNPSLVNSKITVPSVTATREEEVSVFLLVHSNKTDLKGDEIGRLSLKSDASFLHPVYLRLTEKGLYDPNKPFWMEVGSNFDLIDGPEPNNFYSGVFLHQNDIRPFSFRRKKEKIKTSNNFGVFAGVYESKTVSTNSNFTYGHKEYYNSTSVAITDTTKVKPGQLGGFRDSVKIRTSQVVRNLGLFISPQVRLTNGRSDANGIHIFASGWLELQWQRLQLQTDSVSISRLDTISIAKSQLYRYDNLEDGKISIKKNTLADLRSHYFGFGLPIFLKNNNTNLFVNPVMGISNQPRLSLTSKDDIAYLLVHRVWNYFYVIQFRLNEETYGISFTGEVRGLLVPKSPPFISLSISKKFDIIKFLEFSK